MYGILNELEQNDALDFEMRSIIGCLHYPCFKVRDYSFSVEKCVPKSIFWFDGVDVANWMTAHRERTLHTCWTL